MNYSIRSIQMMKNKKNNNMDTNFENNTSDQESAINWIKGYLGAAKPEKLESNSDKLQTSIDYDITYENYVKTVTKNRVVEEMEYEGDCEYRFVTGTVLEDIGGKYDLYAIPFPKEQFIERMKTDEEFAQRWGLK